VPKGKSTALFVFQYIRKNVEISKKRLTGI